MNLFFLSLLTFPYGFYLAKVQHQKYDRILGGITSTSEEFPWQVQLILTGQGKAFLCSGSLIHTRHVLTAAHCLTRATSVAVALGHDTSILNGDTSSGVLFSDVHSWVVHPCFNEKREQFQYDLGIIHLPSSVNISSTIRPINFVSDGGNLYEGQEATAVGWGNTGPEGTKRTKLLLHAKLTVVDKVECAKSYQKKTHFGKVLKGTGYALNMHSGNYFVCARGLVAQAICEGDSGGSLAIKEGTEWVLIGVGSFTSSEGCKNWHKPQSFVRVTKHLNWMQSVVGEGTRVDEKCVDIVINKGQTMEDSSSQTAKIYLSRLTVLVFIWDYSFYI